TIGKIHPSFVPAHGLSYRDFIFNFHILGVEQAMESRKNLLSTKAIYTPQDPLNFEQNGLGQEDPFLCFQESHCARRLRLIIPGDNPNQNIRIYGRHLCLRASTATASSISRMLLRRPEYGRQPSRLL